jgi:GAF domain-containing protein
MDLSHANRLAAMALDMTEQPDVRHTLDHIVSNARQGIACDAVGVLLTRDGGIETAATTDELVKRADDLQLECQEGPCLQAIRAEDAFVIKDTFLDDRWPQWAPKVAQLGWRAVLSVRLSTLVRTVGALNLYSRSADAFSSDDVELAQIFGRHAAIALTGAQYSDSLRAAVSARHLIGQAQGILMERYHVDADRAFTVLRRYSQDRNVKLRTIAEQVIAIHRLPN